ncbi:translocation and assembly module lipoprotein TamL [Aquimarina agarilytica]|uniref:translocation and assembly module lipoprotein TamL n=1 Tax=Aquimarina agarilytica TaxID=1087449 RepID=UPI00028976D2|nr:BamA/TamA family outer membrane protein [Aquimarina agarilytica]
MKIIFPLFLFMVLFITSCNINKFIPKGETLYTGASFNITAEEKLKNKTNIEATLAALQRPQPNSNKLGLYAHYKTQKEKPNFIYKFINKKIGEAPVYQSDVDVQKTENLIVNRLENLGFFYSNVSSKIKKTNKRSRVKYNITVKEPYTLATFQLDNDSLPILNEIQQTLKETYLKKGDRFDLNKLKLERERIDNKLKAIGYYNFNADFLIFELDTNQYKTKKFDLYLRLKKEVPQKALIPYRLGNINVYPNYSVEDKASLADTIQINGVNFIQDSLFFKPKRLRPFVLFKQNQWYNPTKFKTTSKRLSSIGAYKFVNVQFDEKPLQINDSIGYLETNVLLSPLKKRALSAEFQANTKSSGFTGPALSLSHTNRNLFKGGEIVKITAKVGYEIQVGGNSDDTAGLSSTELGLTGDLIFPRLLFPMNLSDQFQYAVPRTKISAGVTYLNRSQLYSLGSFNSSFGYQWTANDYAFHTFNPISISYIRLANSTNEFESILNDNPFLRSSFDQQLIAGMTYNFTYNELNNPSKKNPFYFSSNLEISGNALSLLSNKTNEQGKNTILGVEYAQYIKLDTDFRFTFDLKKEQSIVTRLYGGYGYAYGNSSVLPFSKQFFSGGAYSIRAFRTRSIGPGNYVSNDNATDTFFDRSGDIKLESNIEYRFPLYSFLKGALFVDAGNVWLRNENETLPNSTFSEDFINELAIGAGLGFRVDIQGFVIRLDWAAPIHSPADNIGEYQFTPSDGIFNFAIGYPF